MVLGLKGKYVILRPVQEEDFEVVYRLWNDPEIYRLTDDAYWIPRSKKKFREFFEEYHLGGGKSSGGKENAVFIIELNGNVIGDCGIDIDWRKRWGILWLELLPDYWGKGYGKDVLRVLEEYAKDLGLERLRATVNGWNERSRRLFESMGWKIVAEIPENGWFEGKWWPDYIFEKKFT